MVRMNQTVNGVHLRRSLIGWHGRTGERDFIVVNYGRGAFPWMVRERASSLIALGRGQTLRAALADAGIQSEPA